MPIIADAAVAIRGDLTGFTQDLGEAEEQTRSLGERLKSALSPKVIGAAMTAAGAGIEAFNRSQQEATLRVERLSQVTGMQTGEIRELATSMSNATFPLEDVTALMEMASQRGLRDADSIRHYAEFWDMVGDATGLASTSLAEAGVGLNAVGIAAGDEGQALEAFGFITRDTTQDVGDFLNFLQRTGPQLREMGMDINDAAAVMGVLEHELGLTSRVARTEFRKAVNDSNGDLRVMLETLGVSEEQLASYRGQVSDAGEVIGDFAQSFAETRTPLQRFQSWIGDVMFNNAELMQSLGGLSMVLMGLGPVVMTAGKAFPLLTGAIRGLPGMVMAATRVLPLMGAAFHLMLGPIGLVTLAISALVAAFTLDFLGIRTAVSGAVDDMAMNFGSMGDALHKATDDTGLSFQEMKDAVKEHMAETGDSFETAVRKIRQQSIELTDAQREMVDSTGASWEEMQGIYSMGARRTVQATEEMKTGLLETLGRTEEGAIEVLETLRARAGQESEGTAADIIAAYEAGEIGAQQAADALAATLPDSLVNAREIALAEAQATVDGLRNVLSANEDAYEAAWESFLAAGESTMSDHQRRLFIEGALASEEFHDGLRSDDSVHIQRTADYMNDLLGEYEQLAPGALARGEMVNPALQAGIQRNLPQLLAYVQSVTGKALDELTMEEANQLGFLNIWNYTRGIRRAETEAGRAAQTVRWAAQRELTIDLTQAGRNAGQTFANGLFAMQYTAGQSAGAVAAQVRNRLAIFSEPKEGPLVGITKWGGNLVLTIVKDMLAHLRDARQAAGAVGEALIPETLAPAFGTTGWRGSARALATVAGGERPAVVAGDRAGTVIERQWVLNVEGVPRVIGSKQQAIEELERIGESWG